MSTYALDIKRNSPPLMRLALLCLAAMLLLLVAAASKVQAETRTLSLYYTHTKESATVTFKRNGKYVPSGLRKLNRLLRDFRRNEPTKMDPKLFDLVWEVYQKSGSKKPIHVISGYRSPRTNNMLRRRGRNVARNSQHTKGKALDFFLPDVPVAKLRALGLQAHGGGVGFYRSSFIHLDTGRVRHWPRMSRRQLAKVFPKGRTLHVPSDGRPMKGYRVAKANLSKGLAFDGSRRKSGSSRPTLIASLFQGNDKEETRPATRRVAEARPTPRRQSAQPRQQAPARRAAPSGPDPFAMEVAAVRKAEQQQDATPDDDANVELPTLVAIPRARPSRPGVVDAPATQLASGPTPPAAVGVPGSAEGAGTQLAYAPAASEPRFRPSDVLRPRASVPGATEITGNVGDRQQQLRTRVQTALDRPQEAARQQAPAATSNPSGSAALRQALQAQQQLAAKASAQIARQSALRGGVGNEAAQQPSTGLQSADAINVPVPTLRRSIAESGVEPQPKQPAETTIAALPKAAPDRVIRDDAVETAPSREAFGTRPTGRPSAGQAPINMKGELALGDLDSDVVKQWALAHSTRIGPIATLSAPDYDKVKARAIPAAVYPVGFTNQRLKVRADRFSGRSMTRVAFARLPGQ